MYLCICSSKAFNSLSVLVFCYNDLNGGWRESKEVSWSKGKTFLCVSVLCWPQVMITSVRICGQKCEVLLAWLEVISNLCVSMTCNISLPPSWNETWSDLAQSTVKFQMFTESVFYHPLNHLSLEKVVRDWSLQAIAVTKGYFLM